MMTRLLHVDFDAAEAAVAVYADGSDNGREAIPLLLDTLATNGVRSVTFHSDTANEDALQTTIAMSTSSHAIDCVVTCDPYTSLPYDQLQNAVWSNRRAGEVRVARTSPPVYGVRFTDLDKALERVTSVVLILDAANAGQPIPTGYLRLACYELVANTVEHGNFVEGRHEIRMGIRQTANGVQLSFRDNAEAFDTKTLTNVDVGTKITKGERRGLGLFMLSKISDSLTYERSGPWNITTLSIPDSEQGKELRRKPMSEINIMITPCNADKTIVLRPVGTIDSVTSSVLEAQIAELISQDMNRIIVDMADVEFISSSGIGVFLGSVSGLRSRGGDLLFMNVPPHVEDVFDIVNLKDYFRTISSLEELLPSR